MNYLPLLAFTVAALGNSAPAETPTPPAEPQPAASAEAASAASVVDSLSDAECLAIADFMQRADRAAMGIWSQRSIGVDSTRSCEAAKAIAALPMDDMPEDFRRYMAEYCALVSTAMEKHASLQRDLSGSSSDETWDIQNEITNIEKRLRDDILALSARYSRASILGSGRERSAYDRAKSDLRIRRGRAVDFLKEHPEFANNTVETSDFYRDYLACLLQQPCPEISAEAARHQLKRQECLKQLDPTFRLEHSSVLYACREGDCHAFRFPHIASMGCTWRLADSPAEDGPFSIEWQVVPTDNLRVPKPHGSARANMPLPSTPESAVATLHLKKAGTLVLNFHYMRDGDDVPLASKTVVIYLRRTDDYRPLMETDPLPAPEPPGAVYEPGMASLTDDECFTIFQFLQKAYCAAMEECAQAIDRNENVYPYLVASREYPGKLDKLPQDFHDYLIERYNLNIRHRAKVRALEKKETALRQGKGISQEERKELRKQHRALEQEERDNEKKLREKYPRACILANSSIQEEVRKVYRSYNNTDAALKRFYAQNPAMKEASRKTTLIAYFRYLAAERARQEQSLAAARRCLERLDALRIMQAQVYNEPTAYISGEEGEVGHALILPHAPETGFSWHLETPQAEDAPMQVEWRQMDSGQLRKLRDMALIRQDIPQSAQVSVAIVRLVRAGEGKLCFVCTRPGDDEPLLTERAEIEVRAREQDEDEDMKQPLPTPDSRARAEAVAAMTDAECVALSNFLRRVNRVSLLVAADAIEQEETAGAADFVRAAAAELTDDVPADIRDFVHAYSALVADTQSRLAKLQLQLRELRHSDAEDKEEQARPLFKQAQRVQWEFRRDCAKLKCGCLRAAFLTEQLEGAAEEALAELENEGDKAEAFLKANPKLKKGKRMTAIAFLRHLAAESPAELSEQDARRAIVKQDLLSRLGFSQNGCYSSRCLSVGDTRTIILPDDSESGYRWKLTEPLSPDAPVQLEWHTMPGSELRELQAIGVIPQWQDIPDTPEVTIATVRAQNEGKVTLTFAFCHPDEEEALSRQKESFEVREKED